MTGDLPPTPDSSPATPAETRVPGWAGPCAVALAGVVMLTLSWRKWPDLLIDFGQQVYLAWQMAEGRTLYEDLVCNYGPLAPYANAWAFQCFGSSVMTLVGLNLLVFVGITSFTYLLLRRIGTGFSAATCGVLLMLVFGFSQMFTGGNFNYAAPYENSLTIGLLPALAALWLTLRHLETSRAGLSVGVCLGLAFLTKPEVFLAGAAGVLSAWTATAWLERWSLSKIGRTLGLGGLGLLAPVVVAIGLLTLAMPLSTAVFGALGSWPATLGSEATELAFYRRGMGLDDIGSSLSGIAISAGIWALVSALAIAAGVLAGRSPVSMRWPLALLAGVVVAIAGSMVLDVSRWHMASRPLQLLALLAAALAIARLWRLRDDSGSAVGQAARQDIARLAFAAFAGALLLKMILNVRIYHYGFVLAMPAGMLAITFLIAWLPQWVTRRGGSGVTTAAIGLALLCGFSQAHVRRSMEQLAMSDTAVGEGANRILTNERAHYVNPVLALIERLDPATVAVFPEGSIINFLTACPNPTPFYNFVPTGYSIFGEQRILDSLRDTPPDVIVLCERDTSEFGSRYFGTDYARQTLQWIEQNYRVERVFGEQPLRGKGYGIAVWRRR